MNAMTTRPFADAQAAYPFVIAQGRNIETRIYQRRYPAFNYALAVPVVTEGNPWAIGTTFFTVDSAGEAKFLSGAAADMPFNQATKDMASHDFAMIGSGWEWNLEEINQAALYGMNLNATKAMSAADKVERLLHSVAMYGSTEKNWVGFTNYTGVSRADVPADGDEAGGTDETFWANKTPAQILRDMNLAVWTVRLQSNQVEIANTLALPPEAMQHITITYVGTEGTSPTIIERFRATNPNITIIELPELTVASNDGGGRMVAYRRDEEVLRFHLPMPRNVLQPRQKNLMGWETGIIARTGGTEVRLPGAMAYFDEITAPPS